MKRNSVKLLLIQTSLFGTLCLFNNCGSGFDISKDQNSIDFSSGSPTPEIIFTKEFPVLTNAKMITTNFLVLNKTSNMSISCNLNGEPPQDCSSLTMTYQDLKDGDYLFSVIVDFIPQQENPAAKISRTFRMDSTAPVVTVSMTPAAITGSTSADFIFSAVDSLSGIEEIDCSLDSAAFAACVSPLKLMDLSAGSHNLRIQATDKAGNASSTYSYSWTIDLTAPVITIETKPASFTKSTSATFSFSSSISPTTFECQIDGGAYVACTSPQTYNGLADKVHNFKLRGTDFKGSVSSPVSYSWTIDIKPPSAPILTSDVSSPTKLTSVNFSFSSTDDLSGVSFYKCSMDGAPAAVCSSPKNFTALTEGSHTLKVTATDLAGNISPESSLSLVVDSTKPVLAFSETPPSTGETRTATFAFSAADTGSGLSSVQCSLDGQSFANCISPTTLLDLSVDSHNFRVQAQDKAGNINQISYSWTITGSELPPVTYSPAIVISTGGTYTGNWENYDPAKAAVLITTTAPVTLINCRVRGVGKLISSLNTGTQLTVKNCIGLGLPANTAGVQPGRFINLWQPASLVAENNTLISTGGIYVSSGGYTSQSLTVRYNKALNIEGRWSDGKGGYSKSPTEFSARQFFQANGVRATPNIEVAWNEIINEPSKSRVEDNINIYLSSGTSTSPMLIHDNYIQGAYPADPLTQSFSGGGIITDGGTSNLAEATGYVKVYDNQIIGTSNYGLGIPCGHDVTMTNNRVLSSGKQSDQQKIYSANVGVAVYDSAGTPTTFFNHTVTGNVYGWMGWVSSHSTFTRNDAWVPALPANFQNYNTRLPAGDITTDAEANEWTLWQNKLKAASLIVGSSLN